jgi:hypothetical protein
MYINVGLGGEDYTGEGIGRAAKHVRTDVREDVEEGGRGGGWYLVY